MEDTTTKNEKKETSSNKGGKSNKGLLLILGTIALIALALWFGRGFLDAGAAATVNGEVITKTEYSAKVKQIERQYQQQLLMGANGGSIDDPQIQAQIMSIAIDELVNERLFLQAARTANVTIDDAEVERELQLQRDGYPDEASYQADLREAGVTEEELRMTIKNQLTIIAYAKTAIPESEYVVTEEEMRGIYDQNYSESLPEGSEEQAPIPTFEEFTQTYRDQFELQKLGMAVGPLVEELRTNAKIEIHVDIPEVGTQTAPTPVVPEIESNLNEETSEPSFEVQDNPETEAEVLEGVLQE